MDPQTRPVCSFPLANGATLEITLHYDVGGHSFLTGDYSQRGYSLHAQAVHSAENGRIRTYRPFNGAKHFLKEAKRFSKKALGELARESASHPKIEALKAHVLAKEKTTLAIPASTAA